MLQVLTTLASSYSRRVYSYPPKFNWIELGSGTPRSPTQTSFPRSKPGMKINIRKDFSGFALHIKYVKLILCLNITVVYETKKRCFYSSHWKKLEYASIGHCYFVRRGTIYIFFSLYFKKCHNLYSEHSTHRLLRLWLCSV